MTEPPFTLRHVIALLSEARHALAMTDDRDRDRARARARMLTLDACVLIDRVAATDQERGALCHRIADLFRELEEDLLCELVARAAIELEAVRARPRPLATAPPLDDVPQ